MSVIDVNVVYLKDLEVVTIEEMCQIATDLLAMPDYEEAMYHQARHWSFKTGKYVNYQRQMKLIADWHRGEFTSMTPEFMRQSLGVARLVQAQIRLYRLHACRAV